MVEVVDEVTDELVEALTLLLPQLSSSAPLPDRAQLEALVESEAATLLVARDAERRIVGSLTLVVFRIPTGVRAWIEDVVVDARARGAGVGAALTEEALQIAEAAGARTVELTSRPSREAANALYRRVGFVQRETNVFRYVLAER
jgi:ribosomal protein S18 acetylase RimI-like enzyme